MGYGYHNPNLSYGLGKIPTKTPNYRYNRFFSPLFSLENISRALAIQIFSA